jgi:hypothetical protein
MKDGKIPFPSSDSQLKRALQAMGVPMIDLGGGTMVVELPQLSPKGLRYSMDMLRTKARNSQCTTLWDLHRLLRQAGVDVPPVTNWAAVSAAVGQVAGDDVVNES